MSKRTRDTYEQDVVLNLIRMLKNLGFMIIFSTNGINASSISSPSMKGDVMAFKYGKFFPFEVKGEGPFETQIHDDAIGKSLRYTSYHARNTFSLYYAWGESMNEVVVKLYDIIQQTEIKGDRILPVTIVTSKYHKRIRRSIREFKLPIGYMVLNFSGKNKRHPALKFYNCKRLKELVVRANKSLRESAPETRRRRKYNL